MNPQLVDTGKVYSIKPEDRKGDFTFTRSSAATRVNADGLVEKETQNLLLQSNQFDTTWGNSNTTETGGQADKDGGTDAWLLTKSAGIGYLIQSLTPTGVQTASIYAKAGDSDWVYLQAVGTSTTSCYFDLVNGTTGVTGALIDKSIESVGNGWYRCSITSNQTLSSFRIYPAEANSLSATSGSVYIQDAQVEQGLVARDYIETTTASVEGGITDNVPRLDYTDSSCPALLLEPQRRNLVDSSEYLGSLVGVTASYVDSPEGLNNATRLTENTATSQHFSPINASGIVLGQTYALSFYIRKGTYNNVLVYTQSSKMSSTASITFSTETISVGGAVAGSPFMNSVGNGWYRCGWVGTAIASGTMDIYAAIVNLNPSVGDGTSYIDYYGFQVEDNGAGGGTSYATSYIPTYGTSVTRVQDSFYGNNYQANNIFGTNSGSIFFDFGDDFTLFDGVSNSSPIDRMQFVDVTSYGGGYFRFRGGETNHYLQLVNMNAGDTTLTFGSQTKYCICWDSNGVNFYGNGALIDSTTIGIVPSINRIESGLSGTQRETRIKEILFFTTKLSSQEAIDLTTI